MPNFTAIETLTRFIKEKHLKPMRPWRSRVLATNSHANGKKLKRNIRMILGLVSGGDITAMLKFLIHKRELKELCQDSEEVQALRNLADFYKQIDFKKRYTFVRALKESGISLRRMKQYGFNISEKLWSNCDDGKERNKGGGRPIARHLREAIKRHLDENSRVASNRVAINNDSGDEDYKKPIAAKILEKSLNDLYKSFPLANQITIWTFCKYARKTNIYKKPSRLTDLCDYCERGKSIEKNLIRQLEQLNYTCHDNNFDLQHLKHFLEQQLLNANHGDHYLANINKLIEDVNSYEVILFHRKVARDQREEYNSQRTQIDRLRNKLLIEVDFKQKITIGFGPRQANAEYYDKRQRTRTCLGFGVYYVDDEHDCIKSINFDIIASDDSQEARVVVRGFRILREQTFFHKIDKPEYIVWTDCGKHFRNSIIAGYLFRELSNENITVNWNFFCEKHGKSARDAHFSMVSKFVQAESLRKRLISSKDVADAIENGQRKANENKAFRKLTKGNEPITTYAIALDFQAMINYKNKHPELKRLAIKNMENYYNLKAVKIDDTIKIMTSLLSNQTKSIEINEIKCDEIVPEYDIVDEDILNEEDMSVSIQNQSEKRKRITQLLDNLIKSPTTVETPVIDLSSLKPKCYNLNEQNHNAKLGTNKPEYCRGRKVGSKPDCRLCQAECSLSIERLLKDEYDQETVLEELGKHHHAKYRNVPNSNGGASHQRETRARTKKEGARELADHYVYSHQIMMKI